MRRGQDRIDNMVIETQFVKDLRGIMDDEMAERLNMPDKSVQVRIAAEMMCLNALINRLIKATVYSIGQGNILHTNLIIGDVAHGSDGTTRIVRVTEVGGMASMEERPVA